MSPGKPPLRLLVRADDAASARAANEAIAETVAHGIVRNVSVMAVGPALDHAAGLLKDLPGVAFGLHCTLNAEWATRRWRPLLPPADIPSLVEQDGAFTEHPRRLVERGFSPAEIEAELAAQLARLRAAGFRPSYLDTHMGFQWLPGVGPLLAAFAAREGLALDDPATHPRLRLPEGATLAGAIAEANGGPFVCITHPGKVGEEMNAFHLPGRWPGLVSAERDAERVALQDPALLARVADGSLVLERYA